MPKSISIFQSYRPQKIYCIQVEYSSRDNVIKDSPVTILVWFDYFYISDGKVMERYISVYGFIEKLSE